MLRAHLQAPLSEGAARETSSGDAAVGGTGLGGPQGTVAAGDLLEPSGQAALTLCSWPAGPAPRNRARAPESPCFHDNRTSLA